MMLALSLLAALCSLAMIGFGIVGTVRIGTSEVIKGGRDSAVDGPLKKSSVTTTDLGVKAEASSFHGKSKSVRVKGTFTPSDAAAHPKIAFLLVVGFCGFIASFGLFWFTVISDVARWLAVPMWLVAASIAIGYPRRVSAERRALSEGPD